MLLIQEFLKDLHPLLQKARLGSKLITKTKVRQRDKGKGKQKPAPEPTKSSSAVEVRPRICFPAVALSVGAQDGSVATKQESLKDFAEPAST